MSTEAHKLIGISLSKIAQSRASRGGVSLHKNLLVATVLHKARYIFMEEAYQIVHGGNKLLSQDSPFNYKMNVDKKDDDSFVDNDNNSVDEFSVSDNLSTTETVSPIDDDSINESTDNDNDKLLSDISDDEWHGGGGGVEEGEEVKTTKATGDSMLHNDSYPTYKNPPSYQAHIELTYLNLDKCSNTTSNATNKDDQVVSIAEIPEANNNLKRRHSEWEVEEAVLSILPKRSKSFSALDSAAATTKFDENNSSPVDTTDFTFLDESDFLSEPSTPNVSSRLTGDTAASDTEKFIPPPMEIDRLSSLVSIFSFANLTEISGVDDKSSSHSISTSSSDQCSTQAKDNSDVLQPMPSFLAMTV